MLGAGTVIYDDLLFLLAARTRHNIDLILARDGCKYDALIGGGISNLPFTFTIFPFIQSGLI